MWGCLFVKGLVKKKYTRENKLMQNIQLKYKNDNCKVFSKSRRLFYIQ
jgi:hypothetical protein